MPRTNFSEVHVGERLPDVRGRKFNDAVFRDCTFTKTAGAMFRNCVMDSSKIDAKDIREVIGTTLTLDCFFFENFEFSPEVFDSILYLLTTGKGNDEKRAALRGLVDAQRLKLFERIFGTTER